MSVAPRYVTHVPSIDNEDGWFTGPGWYVDDCGPYTRQRAYQVAAEAERADDEARERAKESRRAAGLRDWEIE